MATGLFTSVNLLYRYPGISCTFVTADTNLSIDGLHLVAPKSSFDKFVSCYFPFHVTDLFAQAVSWLLAQACIKLLFTFQNSIYSGRKHLFQNFGFITTKCMAVIQGRNVGDCLDKYSFAQYPCNENATLYVYLQCRSMLVF